MRFRLFVLGVLSFYAAAILVATPVHLAEDHAASTNPDADHEPDGASQGGGHDHPSIGHEQAGVKIPTRVHAFVPEQRISLVTHVPTEGPVFVPPEAVPRLPFLTDRFAPRAPPAL